MKRKYIVIVTLENSKTKYRSTHTIIITCEYNKRPTHERA